MLRRQKPSANALDGLYLPCVDRMIEARWVEGCAVPLPRHTGIHVSNGKVARLSFTHDGVCGFSQEG